MKALRACSVCAGAGFDYKRPDPTTFDFFEDCLACDGTGLERNVPDALVDSIMNLGYKYAVAMHESIEAGRGAVGWNEVAHRRELGAILATALDGARDAAAIAYQCGKDAALGEPATLLHCGRCGDGFELSSLLEKHCDEKHAGVIYSVPGPNVHAEQGDGDRCSCGWTSHTKAWRAHAAHMRRRGFTTVERHAVPGLRG